MMRINPFTSCALDALRLFAAFGVVFAHLDNSRLYPGTAVLQSYGGCFVVVFFVISGYVIAATTDPSRCDVVRYYAIRLGRLWTVAIPALLLALVLQMVGGCVNPQFFATFDRGHSMLRFGLAAIFANEFWFASSGPPMVLPVWSLAYEFWYYVLFGIFVYVRKHLSRALALLLVCAIAGPKILALLPIWLLGAMAWRIADYRSLYERWARPLIGFSTLLVLSLVWAHPRWPGKIGFAPWFFSGAWISDWLIGIGVAGVIVGMDALFHSRPVPRQLNKIIKRGAGVSFSLYLLHYPLMAFAAGVLPYDHSSAIHVAGVLTLIFVVVYFFGSYFEPKRKQLAVQLEVPIRSLWTRFGMLAGRSSLLPNAAIVAEPSSRGSTD